RLGGLSVAVAGDRRTGVESLANPQAMPSDWLTALRALEGSAWAREALGEDFLKIYLAIKQAEYRAFMGEVGEQDWRWYLTQA
ncbi:hypothetical protein Q4R45_20910, partial [Morganella morganii subsp. sibonii]